MPSVYEYGDEDLGKRGWRGGERSETKKSKRLCVSEVLFQPALWTLAGFLHWIQKRVCLHVFVRVCGANESVYVHTQPMAAGQSTRKHVHTNTSFLIHFPSHTIPTIFSTPLNTTVIANSQITYTYESSEWHFSTTRLLIPVFIFSLIHSAATICCTPDKPMWLSQPPALIHMQLSSKTNSRPFAADCISVSPSISHYRPHELWIFESVRKRDHKGPER